MDGVIENKVENFKRIYSAANTLGNKIINEKVKIRQIILFQEEVLAEKERISKMNNNAQPNNLNYMNDVRNRQEMVKIMEKRVDNMQVNLLLGLRKVKGEIEDHITNLERVIAKSRQTMVTPPPEEDGHQVVPPGTPEAHLVRAGFAGPVFNYELPGNEQRGAQGMAQGNMQRFPQVNMQGMAQGNMQGMAQGYMQGMAQRTVQGMAQGTVQGIVQGTVQGIAQGNVPGIARGKVQENAQGLMQGKFPAKYE